MSRAQVGWRDLSQPSIRQQSQQPPPAPPLRVSRGPAPRPALPARRAAPPHTAPGTRPHGSSPAHTDTHTPHTPPRAHALTPTHGAGAAPAGWGSAAPAGIPGVVAPCGGVCPPGPARPPGPRVRCDAQRSRGCWSSRSPYTLPRKVSPGFPPALRGSKVWGFFFPPVPSTHKAGFRRSLLPTLGWRLRCCLPSLSLQLPEISL